MPADLFHRTVDLDLLYPPFLERLLELKARAAARGSRYLCTFGFRTVEESDALHRAFMAGGPRAARGGYSSHNFGLASDEALIVTALRAKKRAVTWGSKPRTVFKILGEEAAKLGLHWGANYSDEPHVSWPGFVSGADLAPLRKIWAASEDLLLRLRLSRVWEYVDAHSPAMPPI